MSPVLLWLVLTTVNRAPGHPLPSVVNVRNKQARFPTGINCFSVLTRCIDGLTFNNLWVCLWSRRKFLVRLTLTVPATVQAPRLAKLYP